MPSEKILAAKKQVVADLVEDFKSAKTFVFVASRGLTVEQDTRLRKTLRENNITYKVYKNTMINFAIQGTEFEGLAPYLEGPTAIAISTEDATAPARAICKFAKEAPKLEVKAGIVEGTAYDAAGITQIASVPSKEELLAKLLGSMKSPISNLARVINQIAEQQQGA